MTNSRCSANTFLAGAVVGAVIVALTTPKNGPQVRSDLLRMGHRAKAKLAGYGEELDRGMEDRHDVGESVRAAWTDVKNGASKAGQDLKNGLRNASEEFRS